MYSIVSVIVNKHFAYLKCTHFQSERCCDAKSALYYFLYEGKYIARFSCLDYVKMTASSHKISFLTKKNAEVNNHLT